MKTMFIDESGSLINKLESIDLENDFFLTIGIIIDHTNKIKLKRSFRKLKKKYFKNKKLIFHQNEFTNPDKSKNIEFQAFKNASFRKIFFPDLTNRLSSIDFGIVGFYIQTSEYLKILTETAPDPYILGISSMLNSFVDLLESKEQANIIAEKRSNQKLDNAVIKRWTEELQKHDRVGITTKKEIEEHRLSEPTFVNKDSKYAGLELADLVANCFYRKISGKRTRGINNEIPFETLEPKIKKFYKLP